MKKMALLLGSHLWLLALAWGQANPGVVDSSFIPRPQLHYVEEYTFDSPTDTAAWQTQKAGLHLSFASTNDLYFRTEVPRLTETLRWEETGWRGERLNSQLLVWAPDTINQVRIQVSDLVNGKGQSIGKEALRVSLLRYVLSNYPYGARDATCGEGPTNKAYLLPQRLEAFERFDLPGRTVRPLWLSVDVPARTAPGVYTGTLEVRSEKGTTALQVRIRVQEGVLPPPAEWAFRLDLWQNPWALARYYQVEPWSAAHKAYLKKHLALYAGAGGKFITTYAVHSPWSDVTYRVDEAMVEWIKRKDGSWKFDYRIFDQYVQLAMEAGIREAITVYTPIPWGNRFRYKDEATGNYIYETWEPTSDKFRTFWHLFLTDLQAHLEKKGWMEKTYLGINENPMEQTLAAIRMVRDHSKKWKITYAGDWHASLDGLLDDYSSVFGKEPKVEEVARRSARKQTTTYYICCTPPKPNTFVFSPPVEARWLGWYTLAHGYDGLLRWAYDSWPADPMRDARHVFWGAGDTHMVYPTGPGLHFEKMREGIQDYEKLRLLRQQAVKSPDKEVKALWQALEKHLKALVTEKEFNTGKLTRDVEEGRRLLAELSERLARKV